MTEKVIKPCKNQRKLSGPADEDLRTEEELSVRATALRKAGWRLVPFLGLMYFISFLDRVNIGFAALTMNADLGLSASSFGLGAGIFFVGYIAFAIPANLILQKLGAARWMAIISITWGLVSMAMAFVQTPMQFYVLRFILGAAESGFFPGVILYLSTWFPDDMRGRIIGNFFIAVPLSNVLGAPLSSWLLTHSLFGLVGWQTMFIVEATPAILLGVVALFWLTDHPERALWLKDDEKVQLLQVPLTCQKTTLSTALCDRRIWLYGLIYFLLVLALYGFGFFAPQILRELGGLTTLQTGWLTALPYLAATVVMVFWTRHSDQTEERTWHLVLSAFVGCAGFLLAAFGSSFPIALFGFAMAASGIYAACPVFWTLPTRLLSGTAAAGGIALINSIGNAAGYAGPYMMGALKEFSGSYTLGLAVIAIAMALAGIIALVLRPKDPPDLIEN